jgi:hypothetical protein
MVQQPPMPACRCCWLIATHNTTPTNGARSECGKVEEQGTSTDFYSYLCYSCLCVTPQATLPNQMHAQLTELNGLKGNLGRRCIVMGLISSQVPTSV